jgi:hypothetical protein
LSLNVSIEAAVEKEKVDFVDEQLIAGGSCIEESSALTQFIVEDLSSDFENMGHEAADKEEDDQPLQMGVFTQAALMDMEPVEMGIFTQVAMETDDMEPPERPMKRRKRSISDDIEPYDNFSGRSYRRSRPYRLPDEVMKEIERARSFAITMTDVNQNIAFEKYSHDDCEASLPF